MTVTNSPFFNIQYGWATGDNGWGDPVNNNLKVLSFLDKGAVDDVVSTLPTTPTTGSSYILTTDNLLYVRFAEGWMFITPQAGMEVTKLSDGTKKQWNGSAWIDVTKVKISDLVNSSGSSLVGWARSPLTSSIVNVHQALDTLAVSLWEFASLVTSKPTPSDPNTWDWTPAIQAGLNYTQSIGAWLEFPEGDYTCSSGSITTTPSKSVRIRGSGKARILVSNPASKTSTTDQSFTASTTFIFPMDGDSGGNASNRVSSLYVQDIQFVNKDTSANTRLFYTGSDMRSAKIINCRFEMFSCVGTLGIQRYASSIHTNSDALTSVDKVIISDNYVTSDSAATGQAPKSFHLHHCHDSLLLGNTLLGNGGTGLVYRVNGGTYDTIPNISRGSANVKVIGNHFETENVEYEYNQITKSTNVTITGNTADASRATNPDNMFDVFNCINMTFANNTAVGGGLLFFGHADLNNGSFPANLIGPSNLTATGNSITNPSHYAIFNVGGDGGATSNRACRNVTIEGNTVYCTPGYTPSASRATAFVDAFLVDSLIVRGNRVSGIQRHMLGFFNLNVVVDGEHMAGAGGTIEQFSTTGHDTQQIQVGNLTVVGNATGLYSASTASKSYGFANNISVTNDSLLSRVYTATATGAFSVGSTAVLPALTNTSTSYLLLVHYSTSTTPAAFLYIASVRSSGTVITPVVSDNTKVIVTVDASNVVTATAQGATQATVKISSLRLI